MGDEEKMSKCSHCDFIHVLGIKDQGYRYCPKGAICCTDSSQHKTINSHDSQEKHYVKKTIVGVKTTKTIKTTTIKITKTIKQ